MQSVQLYLCPGDKISLGFGSIQEVAHTRRLRLMIRQMMIEFASPTIKRKMPLTAAPVDPISS